MSRSSQENITCPKCGKDSSFTVWHSINTTLDPEMKAAVRDRSTFLFTCPHCDYKAHVDYGFLYHQMEDQIMIHYARSEEAFSEVYDFAAGKYENELLKDFPNVQAKYLNRIVRSMNQLLEKLAIFDAGLDDRIIEICKVLILTEYQENHPESRNIELLMFTNKENKHIIQIIDSDETAGYVEITDNFYDSAIQFVGSGLKDIREDHEPLIDRAWALAYISDELRKKHNKEGLNK